MKTIFFLACIFNIVWFIFVGVFISKRLKNRLRAENEDFLKIITKYIDSIRYGKITEKIDDTKLEGINKTLAQSINRMSETLVDRENMIQEYEKIMLSKNQSLEELIKKEQDAHTQRKDFIATLGHDLKVPILAAENTLEFLLDGTFGELNSKQYEVLSKMKNSNSDLIVLVENILDTYKNEEQNFVLQKSLIDLQSLILSSIEEVEDIAKREEIKIETQLEKLEISVDAFQMKRVIKNLLYNAISYSSKNSVIQVSLKKNKKDISITVTDYGVGIEKEDLPHVFEKYYSCAKKFRKVGTGLGLYLSKQIVEAHGGVIEVNSIPHEKTEFTIKLFSKI